MQKAKLKEFVQTIVAKESIGDFPNLYIVDQETGPFRRIQEAIDAAEPHSLIKVTEGFYEENLTITKPLTIEPKYLHNLDSSHLNLGVVLLVESGIGIKIDLPRSDDELTLTGMKVSHSGNSAQLKMELLEHQHIINIFQNQKCEIEQVEHEYINRVVFNKLENMVIYVERGRVSINNCVVSLCYLLKSCRATVPCICVDREAEVSMVNSEVKGNLGKETVGVLCKLGIINIKNCVITEHNLGGILTWGVGLNSSKIMKNKIQRNSIGIHAVGEGYKLKVYMNQVMGNQIGIKIGLGSQVEISRNYIFDNINGIEINSSFPIVYLNKIEKQHQNGIVTRTYKKMICMPKIRKNVAIVGNKHNGILVEGENNKTKVLENYLIGFNASSGIKVTSGSFPLIFQNKIFKNYQEGVLITENTNAVVEKNEITSNVQCNLSLGGINSNQTLIVENKITQSLGPGLIMIEGSAHISRNDIQENQEGLRLIQSGGNIRRNYIANNHNNGVTLGKYSSPTFVENFITRNHSVGLFLRDENLMNQYTMIHSNIIVSNEINVGLELRNESVGEALKQSNTIEGPIEEPAGTKCAIM